MIHNRATCKFTQSNVTYMPPLESAFRGKFAKHKGLPIQIFMMTLLTVAMHVNAGVSSHTLQRPGAG